MPRMRFVTPETQRLDLSDGDWIEVKKRLSISEQKRLESAIFAGIKGAADMTAETRAEDVEVMLDSAAAYMAKLELYLLDWSLCDGTGKHVKVTTGAIHALDPDTADEIMTALDGFLEEEDKRRKADPTTATVSVRKSA